MSSGQSGRTPYLDQYIRPDIGQASVDEKESQAIQVNENALSLRQIWHDEI
jgi:hypothetical protein